MQAITLLAVIFFGFIASYQDLKYGIVKNNLILFMLFTGLILNLFGSFLTSFNLIFYAFSNLFFSFIICFFLWLLGLLPGGDAKLIISFSFILSIYPVSSLLVNIFAPVCLALIISAFYRLGTKCFKIIKKFFQWNNFINTFIFVASITPVIRVFFQFIGLPSNFIVSSTLLFLIFHIFKKLKINMMKISILLFFTYLIFLSKMLFSLNYWMSVFYITLYVVFLNFILLIIDKAYSEEIKIEDLKPGMKLSEILIKEGDTYKKENFSLRFFYDLLSLSEKIAKGGLFYLNESTIYELKKLKKEGKLDFNEVRVSTTINFAPYIFLGSLLTIFLQGMPVSEILLRFIY